MVFGRFVLNPGVVGKKKRKKKSFQQHAFMDDTFFLPCKLFGTRCCCLSLQSMETQTWATPSLRQVGQDASGLIILTNDPFIMGEVM